MRSSSSPSADPVAENELAQMRERLVEALRRAEVISLVNAAESEPELGRGLTEELCEAFEAEIAVLAEVDSAPARERVIATTGLSGRDGEILAPDLTEQLLGAEQALALGAVEVDGAAAVSCAGGSYRGPQGRAVVLFVARLYEQAFSAAELALLEAVAVATGRALERLWAHDELRRAAIATAAALANAMEARDDYTAGHAQRIAELAVEVAADLELTEDDVEDLRWGAIFHDIGKIAVPDEILRKPEPLEADEREEMEKHVVVGEQILTPVPFRGEVRRMVRHSHERWDGGGYPDGLAGERIPMGSRIIAVVDAWHAMTSDRPYRGAIELSEAAAELRRHAGTQFDPTVVEVFLSGLEPEATGEDG